MSPSLRPRFLFAYLVLIYTFSTVHAAPALQSGELGTGNYPCEKLQGEGAIATNATSIKGSLNVRSFHFLQLSHTASVIILQ